MTSRYEYPKVERIPDRFDREREKVTHPAYGMVGANRVSGEGYLFGTDYKHSGYVTLHIKRAEMVREMGNDWYHARNTIVKIALSYAQWASLVSTMNVGDGVPCTINYLPGEDIPQIPKPQSALDTFKNEMSEAQARIIERCNQLQLDVAAMNIPQKAKDKINFEIGIIKSHQTGNQPFVAKQFSEFLDKKVSSAKADVEGFMTHKLTSLGARALQDQGAPISGFLDDRSQRDIEIDNAGDGKEEA
jgi:hypothetical protein